MIALQTNQRRDKINYSGQKGAKTMKKRIAALVLALMCQLTSGPAQAVENE